MVTEEEVDTQINILITYLQKTYGTDTLSYCEWHGDKGLEQLTRAARRFLLEKHEIEPQQKLTSHDFERARKRLEGLVHRQCGIKLTGSRMHVQKRGTYSEKPSTEIEMSMPAYVNLQRMAHEEYPIPKEVLETKYTLPSGEIQKKLISKWYYSELRKKADEFSKKLRHYKALKEKDKEKQYIKKSSR